MPLNSFCCLNNIILDSFKSINSYSWYLIKIIDENIGLTPIFSGYFKVDNTNNSIIEFYETINNNTNFSKNIIISADKFVNEVNIYLKTHVFMGFNNVGKIGRAHV